MRKKIFLAILLLLLGLLGWKIVEKISQSQGTSGKSRGEKPPVTVEVVAVKVQDIEDVRSLTGTLKPYSEFTLTAKVSGRLEYLKADEGSLVNKWQQIGKVEERTLLQQVEQLKAELRVAQASQVESEVKLQQTGRIFNREQALYQKNILSDEELDSARSAFETSQAQLHVSQAQIVQRSEALKLARLRYQDTLIKAIWPGSPNQLTVSHRHVDPGAHVSVNAPIVTLMDISRLKARLPIVEKDYGKIKVGQLANIKTDAYPELTFSGKVLRLSPQLNEQTHMGEVELEVFNPGYRLKPGMFIRASLILDVKLKAQAIPLSALVRKDDQSTGLYQVNSDKKTVTFVPITTGVINDTHIEVVKPKLINQIVNLGQHLLKDGAAIAIAEEEAQEKKGSKRVKQDKDSK